MACALGACRREGAVEFAGEPARGADARLAVAPTSFGASRSDAAPSFAASEAYEPLGAWGGRSRAPEQQYPLDAYGRTLPSGQLSCPAVDARDFHGQSLRFSPAARVIEPFRQRLLMFEQVVREVSERVYGRWPSAILVAASYGCRSVNGANRKLSEHALGNAIDITGFEFAGMPWALPAWAPAPLGLLEGFQVRVDRHWQASGDAVSQRHSHFLDELTRQLVQRGVFRTLLGPAHPDHDDHFHFDMAPWTYVNL